MKGFFFVIEGLDGSGGTTQSRMLADWLLSDGDRSEVVLTHEPSTGPVGVFLRSALRVGGNAGQLSDAVLPYLFAADRRDHLDRLVIPALRRNAVVVSDRYYHSSLAYQSLTVGLARVARLNADFRKPDLTIYLDLSPETCLERIIARGGELERFETLDRLRSVAEAYDSILVHCRASGETIIRVDASPDIDTVHQAVINAVQAHIAERS